MFMDDLSHGGAKVVAEKREGAATAVRTSRLDSIFDFSGRSIAIKMDVERHEGDALEGMSNILSHNRVLLQVEIFPENLDVACRLMKDGFRPVHSFRNDYYFVNDDSVDI